MSRNRLLTIVAVIDPDKLDDPLLPDLPDPAEWNVGDFVDAYRRGAVTDASEIVDNIEAEPRSGF